MQRARSNSPRSPITSTPTEDRNELARFRHDINLVSFAASKGYAVDERESSRSCCMMRHADGDKIAIGKAADGHWQYYSFRDERDNGDIIQFVQNRAGGRAAYPLGAVRKELRGWTHTARELPQRAARVVEPVVVDREAVARGVAAAKVLDTHPYLESRGLAPKTLSCPRFRGTWRMDAGRHGNVLFPHHDADGLSGCEVKNHGFTSFSSGGQKGLWCSLATPCDRRLVVTESAIDAMSYHQVNPHPRTRYVSLGGAQNPGQPALLSQAISWMPAGSTIVAATDNDEAGHAFAQSISEVCSKHPHVTFERHMPSLGKDWNDHLQALRRDVDPRSVRHVFIAQDESVMRSHSESVGACGAVYVTAERAVDGALAHLPSSSTVVIVANRDDEGRAFAQRISSVAAGREMQVRQHWPTLGNTWPEHLRALSRPHSPERETKQQGLDR